jgi:hypothetical protein
MKLESYRYQKNEIIIDKSRIEYREARVSRYGSSRVLFFMRDCPVISIYCEAPGDLEHCVVSSLPRLDESCDMVKQAIFRRTLFARCVYVDRDGGGPVNLNFIYPVWRLVV